MVTNGNVGNIVQGVTKCYQVLLPVTKSGLSDYKSVSDKTHWAASSARVGRVGRKNAPDERLMSV